MFPFLQHATQIMEAARAGKAIFCEKPISLNLEIIDEVRSINCLNVMLGLHFNLAGCARYSDRFGGHGGTGVWRDRGDGCPLHGGLPAQVRSEAVSSSGLLAVLSVLLP